jgi:hypothetical protein
MSAKLWNESALGIYVLCWKGTNGRNEVSWFEGLDAPMFSFHMAAQDRMTPPIQIRKPERFGHWPFRNGSHAKTFADFKAFVQAFADECEQSGEVVFG